MDMAISAMTPTNYADPIDIKGFQVISAKCFTTMKYTEPKLSLWTTHIGFNPPAYDALNCCDSVQVMLNLPGRSILIKPVPSSDENALSWMPQNGKKFNKKVPCKQLTEMLYREWGLDPEYRYKSTGKLVTADKKVMLLFDFSDPEKWDEKARVFDE